MKKLIAAFIVGAFLSAGVIGCGPGTTSGTTPPVAGAPKEVKTEGKVTKAEKGKLTIKPTAGGDEKSFAVPDDVKIDSIKVDDTVTITETDGKVTKVDKK